MPSTGPPTVPENTRVTDVSPPDARWSFAEPAESAGFPGYELLGELGHGGMGIVFHARHDESNREVAIKVIRTGRGGTHHRLRFLAEAEAVATVDHPHVVRVLEVNPDPHRPFIAFEYLPNGTLADRLSPPGGSDQPARLAPTAAARLLSKLASGTAAAHAVGVVHRDIKPSNVMFDAAGEPKLTDFGVAKRAESDLTLTGEVIGTPEYMSPEQAKGETKFVGPPADVWALGVILYECLTGTKPFRADTVPTILNRVREANPDRPRRLVPGVPRDLELISLKCLQKEPHERYPTAKELADDLGRFLAGKPLASRPPGVLRQAARWVRRNPVPAAVGLALFLAAGATAVSALVALDRERERASAEAARFDAERREFAATELLRAEQQGRTLDELARAGPGAYIQGRFRDAVADFDRAEASGRPLTPQLRLSRIRALQAVGDSTRLRREFAAIDLDALPADVRGSFELWKAVSLFGTNDAEAVRLVEIARTRPLHPGDRAFADGAVTAFTPEAIEHFRTAIRHDQLHRPARSAACGLLLLCGRLDEAIELADQSAVLFSDAPEFPAMAAVAGGLKGENRAVERLNRLAGKLPAETDELLRAFVAALPAMRRVLRGNAGYGAVREEDHLAVSALVFRLAFLDNKGNALSAWTFGFLPPRNRKAFDIYVRLLFEFQQNADVIDELLAPATRFHPEGFLLFLQLLYESNRALAVRADTPVEATQRFRQLRAAIVTAERAANAPAVFPVQDMSADLMLMLHGNSANAELFGAQVDDALIQGTLGPLRARVARWEELPAHVVRTSALGFCMRQKEYDLARSILSLWERKQPGDVEAYRWRTEIEYAAGAYEAAVHAAEVAAVLATGRLAVLGVVLADELTLNRTPVIHSDWVRLRNLRAHVDRFRTAARARLIPLDVAPPPRAAGR